MKNIYDYTYDKLEEELININEKKYRVKQIFEWLYKHKKTSFNEMTNLSKDTINKLENNFIIKSLKVEKVQKGKDVSKYLFRLSDDNFIEAVLMKQSYGNSICVSSQVGCNIGCSFCESGRLRKIRDLEVHEMVEQIILVEEELKERIDSVVIMGIGEPFDNYDNVINFIKIINNPHGLEIGARHITVSTSGLIPGINKFALENFQVNLAISLHAPNDEVRSKIMKINNVYNIKELIKAVNDYIDKTNRRVTIEYVMLDNINDKKEHAQELSKLLRGMNVYVNLIPYNETSHIQYKKSKKYKILEFYDILKQNKINVTIRREFGTEVDAACGQLRAKEGE